MGSKNVVSEYEGKLCRTFQFFCQQGDALDIERGVESLRTVKDLFIDSYQHPEPPISPPAIGAYNSAVSSVSEL